MAHILLIDDDTTFCLMMKTWLVKRNFAVTDAYSCRDAIRLIENEHFDVILSDLRLPDGDGIELLRKVRPQNRNTEFILMTGYADISTAVTAMKLGAFDYVAKPVIPEEILKKINEALKIEISASSKEKKRSVMSYIMGNSQESLQLSEYIKLVAPTMMTVLITGESGSGKEYIARRIHELSNRKDAPFVAVDCGTITKDLAASEFFGHVKGAFTGATNDKTGFFAEADGGTIFLDEIGNLSYETQIQLLRALEERKMRPVGGTKDSEFDVRIISATNENLQKAVADGNFREDLYHRLNEFSLKALSLRDRVGDIMIFAHSFLAQANEELGKNVIGYDNETERIFLRYNWPGNLREMRNVVKRATLLCQGQLITTSDIPQEVAQGNNNVTSENFALRNIKDEETRIKEALERCNNNKSEAARLLQIDRKTLYNKLKQFNIDL